MKCNLVLLALAPYCSPTDDLPIKSNTKTIVSEARVTLLPSGEMAGCIISEIVDLIISNKNGRLCPSNWFLPKFVSLVGAGVEPLPQPR
jgi:hypothetical protein